MGSSGWIYETDYDEDFERALQKLRVRVFESGEYYKPPLGDLPRFEDWIEQMPPEWRDDEDALRRDYDRMVERAAFTPTTPDEALRKGAEDGTHSIIDIQTLDDGAVLTDAALDEYFGTTEPTPDQVRDATSELMQRRRRWECNVVVAYDDGVPSKLIFVGHSGD